MHFPIKHQEFKILMEWRNSTGKEKCIDQMRKGSSLCEDATPCRSLSPAGEWPAQSRSTVIYNITFQFASEFSAPQASSSNYINAVQRKVVIRFNDVN